MLSLQKHRLYIYIYYRLNTFAAKSKKDFAKPINDFTSLPVVPV